MVATKTEDRNTVAKIVRRFLGIPTVHYCIALNWLWSNGRSLSIWQCVMSVCLTLIESLEDTEQEKVSSQLSDTINDLEYILSRAYFIIGFRWGARMALDILSDNHDTFSPVIWFPYSLQGQLPWLCRVFFFRRYNMQDPILGTNTRTMGFYLRIRMD